MTGSVATKTTVNLATYTSDTTKAGTYTAVLTATLIGYSSTISTAPYNVNLLVKNCIVTSYALTGCASLVDYTILDPARTDSCVAITQVPACGYDSTVSITGIPDPNTIMTGSVATKTTVILTTYTADTTKAGTYNFLVTSTLAGYP
jgi:hypothetical protein